MEERKPSVWGLREKEVQAILIVCTVTKKKASEKQEGHFAAKR